MTRDDAFRRLAPLVRLIHADQIARNVPAALPTAVSQSPVTDGADRGNSSKDAA